MALTKDQWFEKMKGWVPVWWFQSEVYNVALFKAMAAVFAQLDADIDEQIAQTFILQALPPILEAHGEERSVSRLPSEPNPPFRDRIRNITNHSNEPDLKALVDPLLIVGEATIHEHEENLIFCNRGNFFNRKDVFSDIFYDVFTIIVDKQLHAPYSFLNRTYFESRQDFIGSNTSNLQIFEQIVAAINKSKAFGVLYRVVERTA